MGNYLFPMLEGQRNPKTLEAQAYVYYKPWMKQKGTAWFFDNGNNFIRTLTPQQHRQTVKLLPQGWKPMNRKTIYLFKTSGKINNKHLIS